MVVLILARFGGHHGNVAQDRKSTSGALYDAGASPAVAPDG